MGQKQAFVVTLGRHDYFSYFSGAPAPENNLIWMYMCAASNADGLQTQLPGRQMKWADPTAQGILGKADTKAVYRVKTMPPLPAWGKNGIVLVGDAAHAFSPSTGQGAS